VGVTASDKAKSVWTIVALYRQFEYVARESDITLAQYRLMLFLRRGAQRAGTIAAAAAVKKPTISAMLAVLRDKGWIAETSDPSDARAISISLTQAGRARIATFETTLAASIGKLAPGMNLDRLHAALAAFHAGMATSGADRMRAAEKRLLS
jgi:DNA-binding MarR family transcriptional regulator